MPESLAERMARFSNMGGDKPKVEVKRKFEMPVEAEPEKGKGYLDRLMDEVDRKFSKTKRVR